MDIRVYRISTCHWCDKVEAFLRKYGIHYRSIVVNLLVGDEQEKAVMEAYYLSKQRSFPVTYIDGNCIIGFHESRLRYLLKLSAQELKKEGGALEDGVDKGCGCSLSRTDNCSEEIGKMHEWLTQEAKSHDYRINPDQKVTDDILYGLALNEKRYGYKACPCRLATGKYQLDCDVICPCSYCFLDVEKFGRCYCSLFVSDRFISGDPSLPQYVTDSRERSIEQEERVEETEAAIPVGYTTHVKVIGFTKEVSDKTTAKNDFIKIMKSLDINIPDAQWRDNTAYASKVIEDTKVIVALRQDADVYVCQIVCMSVSGKTVNGEEFFRNIDITKQKNKLFEFYIIVPRGAEIKDDLLYLLPDRKYISYAYNKYQIAAGFEAEGAAKDTFIIVSGNHTFDKIVEDIVILEINYHLLAVEKQRYILAEDKLNQLDSTIVAKLGIISMNLSKALPDMLKGWLHGLSNNFGDISGIAEESRHRMNYAVLKRDTVQKIFKDWNESNSSLPHPLLSRFFLENVDNLGDQYQRLFMRIDSIRREMTDLITMLRTKIDLIVQEQSLELQRSVDETTKTQVMMQHTVEGLSVIILSYYTIHLAAFILESLEASHIVHISLATAKAIFVPIAIAFSWFLTFRAKRLIKKHSDRAKE